MELLRELFTRLKKQKPKIIAGNVHLGPKTRRLNYEGMIVEGDFDCSYTKIKSLNGSPAKVGGSFDCSNTAVFSLEGGPSWVGEDYDCSWTGIVSLAGAPSKVGGGFNIDRPLITSLEGLQKVITETEIASLHDIHKQVKHIGRNLYLPRTVKSHVLGVFRIEGLRQVEFRVAHKEQKEVASIINKYLPTRDIHQAQEDLIEAGLKNYARL